METAEAMRRAFPDATGLGRVGGDEFAVLYDRALTQAQAMDLESGNIAGSAADKGGGVYVSNGSFTLSGGSITENAVVKQKRDGSGGGVYVFGLYTPTNFLLSGGSITGNHASEGGGVYLSPRDYCAAFKLSGEPDISGNTAGSNSDPSNLYPISD